MAVKEWFSIKTCNRTCLRCERPSPNCTGLDCVPWSVFFLQNMEWNMPPFQAPTIQLLDCNPYVSKKTHESWRSSSVRSSRQCEVRSTALGFVGGASSLLRQTDRPRHLQPCGFSLLSSQLRFFVFAIIKYSSHSHAQLSSKALCWKVSTF